MTEKVVKVRISRFDPTVDKKAYYQTYEVPLVQGMSVLDLLDYVYENIDSTLAYYDHAACRHGICAGCNLIIDGKSSLACQTLVLGDITLETPKKFEVIRDLVYKRR